MWCWWSLLQCPSTTHNHLARRFAYLHPDSISIPLPEIWVWVYADIGYHARVAVVRSPSPQTPPHTPHPHPPSGCKTMDNNIADVWILCEVKLTGKAFKEWKYFISNSPRLTKACQMFNENVIGTWVVSVALLCPCHRTTSGKLHCVYQIKEEQIPIPCINATYAMSPIKILWLTQSFFTWGIVLQHIWRGHYACVLSSKSNCMETLPGSMIG